VRERTRAIRVCVQKCVCESQHSFSLSVTHCILDNRKSESKKISLRGKETLFETLFRKEKNLHCILDNRKSDRKISLLETLFPTHTYPTIHEIQREYADTIHFKWTGSKRKKKKREGKGGGGGTYGSKRRIQKFRVSVK